MFILFIKFEYSVNLLILFKDGRKVEGQLEWSTRLINTMRSAIRVLAGGIVYLGFIQQRRVTKWPCLEGVSRHLKKKSCSFRSYNSCQNRNSQLGKREHEFLNLAKATFSLA